MKLEGTKADAGYPPHNSAEAQQGAGVEAVHRWAQGLPWWLHLLVSRWLPELPE